MTEPLDKGKGPDEMSDERGKVISVRLSTDERAAIERVMGEQG